MSGDVISGQRGDSCLCRGVVPVDLLIYFAKICVTVTTTTMAAARDGDTAIWLHNKLGSTDDLWSGTSICSQLTRERLLNIQDCFENLQPHVKVKLILSFIHLPKRNVEEV